jgi:hypothetical protein
MSARSRLQGFLQRQVQAHRAADAPLQSLVPLSWRNEMLLICGGMLLSFLIAGYWYPYWRIADMDFWIVYNSFLLNAGLPQEYFDHPGYLSILLLRYWLAALHSLNLVSVISLAELPRAGDSAAFTQAWTAATRAGRVLSLLFAMGFVVSFSFLLRALVRDWRLAALGGFLLAFSGGMAMQMRIMRTELLATGLFMGGLLILLIACARGPRPARPLWLAAASLLIVLALLNKVQVVFLICALPVLLLPFGPQEAQEAPPPHGFWQTSRAAWVAPMIAAVAAVIAFLVSKDILIYGLTTSGTDLIAPPALAISNKVYWTAIAAWLGAGMIAYGVLWRVSLAESLTTVFSIAAAGMIALLVLDLNYNPNNVIVVFHPLEQMISFAPGGMPAGQSALLGSLGLLLEGIPGLIARRTFILQSSPRPTIFLEWFVIAATIFAWRRGERHLVLQVCVLMLTVWGIDLLGTPRGLKQEYFLFTDPLVIIAGALLVSQTPDLLRHRWLYPVGAALIVAHVAVSQAEPIKHIFKSEGAEVLCGLYHHARQAERLPVCTVKSPSP